MTTFFFNTLVHDITNLHTEIQQYNIIIWNIRRKKRKDSGMCWKNKCSQENRARRDPCSKPVPAVTESRPLTQNIARVKFQETRD